MRSNGDGSSARAPAEDDEEEEEDADADDAVVMPSAEVFAASPSGFSTVTACAAAPPPVVTVALPVSDDADDDDDDDDEEDDEAVDGPAAAAALTSGVTPRGALFFTAALAPLPFPPPVVLDVVFFSATVLLATGANGNFVGWSAFAKKLNNEFFLASPGAAGLAAGVTLDIGAVVLAVPRVFRAVHHQPFSGCDLLVPMLDF